MSAKIERLSPTTELLYSELQQRCASSLPVDRGVTYYRRSISGRDYWCMELSVGSSKRQVHLGPDSPQLREQIEAQKALASNASGELAERQRLVTMLQAGGATTPTASEARVMEVLERAGTFLAGGVLIGSHAFAAYANLLGVRWSAAASRTLDMDVAAGSAIAVGLPTELKPVEQALEESGMGFFPVPALNPKDHSTSYKLSKGEFRVDLLTPLIGKDRGGSIHVPALKTRAHPMRFIDYLLEDTITAAIAARSGILVNVPAPGRFALHKLVVAERRRTSEKLKADKDRRQATLLIQVLAEDRPGELPLAIEAARRMPRKFQAQLAAGIARLDGSLQEALKASGAGKLDAGGSEASPG